MPEWPGFGAQIFKVGEFWGCGCAEGNPLAQPWWQRLCQALLRQFQVPRAGETMRLQTSALLQNCRPCTFQPAKVVLKSLPNKFQWAKSIFSKYHGFNTSALRQSLCVLSVSELCLHLSGPSSPLNTDGYQGYVEGLNRALFVLQLHSEMLQDLHAMPYQLHFHKRTPLNTSLRFLIGFLIRFLIRSLQRPHSTLSQGL